MAASGTCDAAFASMRYPVQLEVTSPTHYDRVQILLRFALTIVLAMIGMTTGWLSALFYFALPTIAALYVSSYSTDQYREIAGPKLWRALRWVFAISAYLLLLTDRFPTSDQSSELRVELEITGHPTTGSALSRILTAFPSALVLWFLGCIGCVLAMIGVVTILLDRTMPSFVLAYQRGFLRWEARLLAYQASLVDEYPPFSFESAPAVTAPPAPRDEPPAQHA